MDTAIIVFICVAVVAFFFWAIFTANGISMRKKNKKKVKSSDSSNDGAYVVPQPVKEKKRVLKIKKRNLEEDFNKVKTEPSKDGTIGKASGGGTVERVFVEPIKKEEEKQSKPSNDDDDFEKELDKLIMDLENEKNQKSNSEPKRQSFPTYMRGQDSEQKNMNPDFDWYNPRHSSGFVDSPRGDFSDFNSTNRQRASAPVVRSWKEPISDTQSPTKEDNSNDFDLWLNEFNEGKSNIVKKSPHQTSENVKIFPQVIKEKNNSDMTKQNIEEPLLASEIVAKKQDYAKGNVLDKSSFDERFANGFIVEEDTGTNVVVVGKKDPDAAMRAKSQRKKWL